MEEKPSKELDGVAINKKRKRATQHITHLTGVSTPICEVVKQMRLDGEVNKPGDSNRGISKSLVMYSRGSHAATNNLKVDGRAMTNKMGGGNLPIAIKQEPDIDLDDNIKSLYGKLDVGSVQKLFLTRMNSLGITESDIVEIYPSSGRLMQMRLKLFQKQADITKEVQGHANVRYAWLACSKEELSIIMEYGPGHYELSPRKCIYGFGIHLAAVTYPFVCSHYCDLDRNGIKHMVLCRVIMGNMELLRPGSDQIRPSGSEYENGVDDIQCPKCYVVWNMNMNTHIFPEFVVSFKSPLVFEGNVCSNESKKKGYRHSTVDTVKATSVPAKITRTPGSPRIPFSLLLSSMRNMVPSRTMFLIDIHYASLMSNKISCGDFWSKLRSIVGNNVLKVAMYNIQFKRPSGGGSNGSNVTKD